MKKNILFSIFTIFILLFSIQNVSALELDENGYYTNANNIKISEQQLENLQNMGFSEREIIAMGQEEFDNNKNLNGEIVAQTTKYYKTITTYSDVSTYSINNATNPTSITIEITEEEYNNSNDELLITPLGNTNGYTETNYKKMTTTIVKNGNYYRYKNDLVWKRMPSTRSYDIQGIGIDSTVSGVSSSKYFKRIADIEDSANLVCYFDNSTSGTWELSGTGYAVNFKLPANTSTTTVTALSSHMYFDVQKLTSATILTLNAYGDYKHAQKTVSSSVSNGVSIGTDGISFDASVSVSITESYDSMSTAQATRSGLSW